MWPQPGTTWGLVEEWYSGMTGESYSDASGESYTDESGESYSDVDNVGLIRPKTMLLRSIALDIIIF